MARPNSAQGKYERQIDGNGFCFDALVWARSNRRLTTAWRKCKDGNWMGWWLTEHVWRAQGVAVGEGYRMMKALAPRANNIWTGHLWTPEEKLQFAKNIRATYFPTGNRRPNVGERTL